MPAREVDLKLVGGRVVTGGGVLKAGVAVDGGTIVAVAPDDLLPPARRTIDVRGNHILPGIVDSEAHPGCYVPFEDDLSTESRAAACAGVTTWGIQAPAPGWAPAVQGVRAGRPTSSRSTSRSPPPGDDRAGLVDRRLPHLHAGDRPAGRGDPAVRRGARGHLLQAVPADPAHEGTADAEDHNWPSRRAGLGHGIDDGTLYLVMEQVGHARRARHRAHIHPENWEIARVFERRLRELGPRRLGRLDRPLAPHPRGPAHPGLRLSGRADSGRPHVHPARHHPRDFERDPRGPRRGVELYAQTGPAWLFSEFRTAGASTCPCATRENHEALWQALARGRSSTPSAPTTWSPGRPADVRGDVPPEHLGLPHRLLPGRDVPAGDAHRGGPQGPHHPGAAGPGVLREPGADLRPVPGQGGVAVGFRRRHGRGRPSREVTVGKEHLQHPRPAGRSWRATTYHGWPVADPPGRPGHRRVGRRLARAAPGRRAPRPLPAQGRRPERPEGRSRYRLGPHRAPTADDLAGIRPERL